MGRQVFAVGAIHRGATPHLLRRTNPGRSHWAQLTDVGFPSSNRKFLHGTLDHHGVSFEREFVTESNRHNSSARMHQVLKASIGHRIRATPQALHVERQQFHLGHVANRRRIIQPKAVHVTGRGHRIFREHHHGLATQKCTARLFHRRGRVRNIQIDSLHLRKQ